MAIKRRSVPNRGYGLDNALQNLAPQPIIVDRAPGTNDTAEIGTTWIDTTNDAVYALTSVSAGAANWATAPASGATTLASLIVTTTSDLQGNTDVGGTLDVVGLTTVDDLTATGTTTISGDLDLSSAALIDLTSTLDAAPSIFLHANGGTSEQILLHADQGTSSDSVSLLSDVGGITVQATGDTAVNAIDINANAGGMTVDCALSLDMASSKNADDAIIITASAGGIDIIAAGAAGEDIDIGNAAGSVNIDGGEAIATAITIVASNAAGGIDITSGTGDTDISSTGNINVISSLDGASSVLIEADGGTSETIYVHSDQGTGAASIHLESDVGGVTLTSGLASDDAINLAASAGGIDIDGATQVAITSSEAATDAIAILASDVAGGIDIDCGTGGIDIASAGGAVVVSSTEDAADSIYLHSNGGTSETVKIHSDQGTGVASIDVLSDVGGITLTSGLASTDAVNVAASAGGIDMDAALEVNITSSEAAVADAVTISASAADGGITLDAGATPGVTFTNGTQSHQMLVGTGSPNTVVTAAQGSMYVDIAGSTSTTILFVNTNGTTNWVGVGA